MLEVKKIPRIRGVGVFARASFAKGDSVTRYEGDLISAQQADEVELRREEVCAASLFCCSSLPQVHVSTTRLMCLRCLTFVVFAVCCQDDSGPQGNVFFGRGFAVDPGLGNHLSHKVNHSRLRANVRAVADGGRGARRGIVLIALRVCCGWACATRVFLARACHDKHIAWHGW